MRNAQRPPAVVPREWIQILPLRCGNCRVCACYARWSKKVRHLKEQEVCYGDAVAANERTVSGIVGAGNQKNQRFTLSRRGLNVVGGGSRLAVLCEARFT